MFKNKHFILCSFCLENCLKIPRSSAILNNEKNVNPENLEPEIVFVGGGSTGMATALTSIENGCTNILVLEKAGSSDGNSAMAHDLFGAESPVQIHMVTDATRHHFLMNWVHWSKVNPRIVRAFIDKSEAIRWLMEKGIKFELGQYYINQSLRIRHCIEDEGSELMKMLT